MLVSLIFPFFIVIILLMVFVVILSWLIHIQLNIKFIIASISAIISYYVLQAMNGDNPLVIYATKDAPLPNQILGTAMIVFSVYAVIELFKWFIIEVFINRRKVSLPLFVLDIGGLFFIILVSLFVVSEVFDADLTGLFVGSTVASAVIGLSLQNILGNLFAGITLQIESPFTIGDWVEVAGHEAMVVRQNWRTLAVLTRNNHNILITNADVAQDKIVNFSRPTTLQALDSIIDAPDSHRPGEIKQILLDALNGIEGLLETPAPVVHVISYGDTCINYRVRYWIDNFDRKDDIEDEVLTRFCYAMHRSGVDRPTPQRELNVRMLPKDMESKESQINRAEIFTLLRPLPLLESLTDSQVHRIAEVSGQQVYTAGELIFRQGDSDKSLYVVQTGEVSIDGYYQNSPKIHIRTIGPQGFFGEMGLITSKNRTAFAVANTETELIIVDKEVFSEILINDLEILEILLQTLNQRRDSFFQSQLVNVRDEDKSQETRKQAMMDQVSRYMDMIGNKQEA